MQLWRKKQHEMRGTTTEVEKTSFIFKIKDVFIAKTIILSSYKDSNGNISVYWYFLVYKKNGSYYNAENDTIIEKTPKSNFEAKLLKNYNIPYIVQLKPISKYIYCIENTIDIRDYFDLVTRMNVKECVSNFVKTQS